MTNYFNNPLNVKQAPRESSILEDIFVAAATLQPLVLVAHHFPLIDSNERVTRKTPNQVRQIIKDFDFDQSIVQKTIQHVDQVMTAYRGNTTMRARLLETRKALRDYDAFERSINIAMELCASEDDNLVLEFCTETELLTHLQTHEYFIDKLLFPGIIELVYKLYNLTIACFDLSISLPTSRVEYNAIKKVIVFTHEALRALCPAAKVATQTDFLIMDSMIRELNRISGYLIYQISHRNYDDICDMQTDIDTVHALAKKRAIGD